jgi:hypothetical protein
MTQDKLVYSVAGLLERFVPISEKCAYSLSDFKKNVEK